MVGDSSCTAGYLRVPEMGRAASEAFAQRPAGIFCRDPEGRVVRHVIWSPPGAWEVPSGFPAEVQWSPETHGLYFTNAASPTDRGLLGSVLSVPKRGSPGARRWQLFSDKELVLAA